MAFAHAEHPVERNAFGDAVAQVLLGRIAGLVQFEVVANFSIRIDDAADAGGGDLVLEVSR